MEANFVETNPGPVKAAMALMGLLEPVWRLPMVAPKPENLAKIRGALEAVGLVQQAYADSAEIERLFDENPARYSDEHLRLFQQFKDALNAGEIRAAEPDAARSKRLARERVGEERHSARISAWARSWICPSTPRGSRFSTSPRIR